MPENVVIIGSGPAAWTAAIYAALRQIKPLVIQGNPHDVKNQQNGTIPLGQLALTTEVENFPSWPSGDTRAYLKSALKDPYDLPYWVEQNQEQPTHGINGPELMALMRQQAINYGTRVESKDVVKVDLKSRPFTLTTHDGETVQAHTLILATGARELPRPAERRPLQEQGRFGLCRLRRGAAAFQGQAARRHRSRRHGLRGGRVPDEICQPSSPARPAGRLPGEQDHGRPHGRSPED